MRAISLIAIAAVALALAANLACAIAVSAEDEASFYMKPGEKASSVPLIVGRSSYLLVLADATPVAILEVKGAGASAMDDPDAMNLVLAQYVMAGFPSVLLISRDNMSYGDTLRTEMLSRIPEALRRKLVFVSQAEIRDLRTSRDSIYAAYNRYRDVNLGSIDSDLASLEALSDQMQSAKSLDAAQKFSLQIEDSRSTLSAELDGLNRSLEDYDPAASAISAAKRSLAIAKARVGEDDPDYQQLRAELLSADYDLTSLEAQVSSGGEPDAAGFRSVASQARAISLEAANAGRAPSAFWWQAAAVIFALGFIVACAALAREILSRKPAGEENLGQKIVRKIKAFEDKAEKEQNRRQ